MQEGTPMDTKNVEYHFDWTFIRYIWQGRNGKYITVCTVQTDVT